MAKTECTQSIESCVDHCSYTFADISPRYLTWTTTVLHAIAISRHRRRIKLTRLSNEMLMQITLNLCGRTKPTRRLTNANYKLGLPVHVQTCLASGKLVADAWLSGPKNVPSH